MSSHYIRSEIASLEKKRAELEKVRNQHEDRANKALKSANERNTQAQRASSLSSRVSYIRAAESENKKYIGEQKRAVSASVKIADLIKRLADKQKSLDSAVKSEHEKEERERKNRQRRLDQDANQRRRTEKDHARDLARLSRPEVRHVIVEPPKPEKLRVLYLTSSPEVGAPLRVDAEVNNVLKAIRGAKYRDQIDLQIRPAASPQDLMDGINDVRPHVVHFSGHGDAGLLAFDNSSLLDPKSIIMTFGRLAKFLAATSTPPKLLVMNACKTLNGSEVLLEAVPALIAMADSVGDASAGVFAIHFYAAIASAQPIGVALKQSQVMMDMALMSEDADLPKLVCREDIDPDTLCLIVAP